MANCVSSGLLRVVPLTVGLLTLSSLLPAASAPVGGDDQEKCYYELHNVSRPIVRWSPPSCSFTFEEVKVKDVIMYNASCSPTHNWQCRPNMLAVNDVIIANYCYEYKAESIDETRINN